MASFNAINGISKSKLLSRLWLPTVVLTVVVVAGLTINAARGIFGSQDRTQSPAASSRSWSSIPSG